MVVNSDLIRNILEDASKGLYQVMIVGPAGGVIEKSSLTPHAIGDNLRAHPAVATLLHPTLVRTTFPYQTPFGQYVGTVATMAETGWGIVVQIEEDKAYRMIANMKVQVMTWSLLLLGLVTLASMLLSRQLSQPIRRLAEVSKRIASGDFGTRINRLHDFWQHINRATAVIELPPSVIGDVHYVDA